MRRRREPATILITLAIGACALLAAVGGRADQWVADATVESLPDLEQEIPADLLVTRAFGRRRAHWRLGFRSAVRNIGDGPLILDAHRPGPGAETMVADQVITREGEPEEVVRGVGRLRYVESPDHQHWHLLAFDRYELRRPGGSSVVTARKTGFCLGDRYRVPGASPPARPVQPAYTSRCGLDQPELLAIREGISVGYGDDYAANLEGQWLPLDGLPPGRYVLVHRVNADRRLRERSRGNDVASLLLRLRWRDRAPEIITLAACPGTPRCTQTAGRRGNPPRHPRDPR